jgi:hypothetical protein
MGGGGTGQRKNEELIGDWRRFRQTLTRRGFSQKYPSLNPDLLHFSKRQVVLPPGHKSRILAHAEPTGFILNIWQT